MKEERFKNIEELNRMSYPLVISEERYGSGLLLGLDHLLFDRRPLADLIDRTTDGDIPAMDAYDILQDLTDKYPEFLFVRADSLVEGLDQLDSKAARWLKLSESEREDIAFQLLQRAYPNEDWAEN